MAPRALPVLVVTPSWHVFPTPDDQLEVAMDGSTAAGLAERRLADLVEAVGPGVEWLEPVVATAGDEAVLAADRVAADRPDALVVSVSSGVDPRLWELQLPILAYSGEQTPMMAMYHLPRGVRQRHPNLRYCLDAGEVRSALLEVGVSAVAERVRSSTMLILDEYSSVDALPDRDELLGRLGVRTAQVGSAEFVEAATRVDGEAAREVARRWIDGSIDHSETAEEEVVAVARLQLALEDLMTEHQAQCVSVGCLEVMYLQSHVPFCWVLAQLRDLGLPAGCEADATATLTMLFFEYLVERPAYMGNLVRANPATGEIAISHGCSPTRMWGRDAPAKPYKLVHSHSAPPFSRDLSGGSGVTSYVDYGDVGETVTVARLGPDLTSAHVARGEIVRCQDTICDRTTLTLKVADARGFVDNAPGNHQVVVYGDCLDQFEALCRTFGMDVLTLR